MVEIGIVKICIEFLNFAFWVGIPFLLSGLVSNTIADRGIVVIHLISFMFGECCSFTILDL